MINETLEIYYKYDGPDKSNPQRQKLNDDAVLRNLGYCVKDLYRALMDTKKQDDYAHGSGKYEEVVTLVEEGLDNQSIIVNIKADVSTEKFNSVLKFVLFDTLGLNWRSIVA